MPAAVARNRRDALGKTLRLLRWMIDAPGSAWGVRELAHVLGLSPSTMHRLLVSLEREGLVQGDHESGRYQFGLEFHRMVWRAQAKLSIRDAAMPFLKQLCAECNETSFLALYDRLRMGMLFAAVVESNHPFRYFFSLNEWSPVYCGASGLAIMAFLPQAERQRIVERTGLAPVTERTITDPSALEEELARIRARGYAITHGQRVPDAVAVAAPIWGADGSVLGDIAITMPEHRYDPAGEPRWAGSVIRHAQGFTERLGGRPPARDSLS